MWIYCVTCGLFDGFDFDLSSDLWVFGFPHDHPIPLHRFPMTKYRFHDPEVYPPCKFQSDVRWEINGLTNLRHPSLALTRSGIRRSQPRSSRRRWIARLNDLRAISSLIRLRVDGMPCVSSLIESKAKTM